MSLPGLTPSRIAPGALAGSMCTQVVGEIPSSAPPAAPRSILAYAADASTSASIFTTTPVPASAKVIFIDVADPSPVATPSPVRDWP